MLKNKEIEKSGNYQRNWKQKENLQKEGEIKNKRRYWDKEQRNWEHFHRNWEKQKENLQKEEKYLEKEGEILWERTNKLTE